jgi:hypothetical protein
MLSILKMRIGFHLMGSVGIFLTADYLPLDSVFLYEIIFFKCLHTSFHSYCLLPVPLAYAKSKSIKEDILLMSELKA